MFGSSKPIGLLLLCLIVAASPAVLAQDSPKAVQVLDIRDLIREHAGGRFAPGPLFGALGDGEEGSLLPAGPGVVAPVPESKLESLLEEWLGGDSDFNIRGGMLTLTGVKADVERCARQVRLLQAQAGRRVRLQLTWFDPGEESFSLQGGRKDVARTNALLAAMGQGGTMRILGRAAMNVSLGGAQTWQRLATTSFLSRYAGEVASKARIAHPQTLYAPTGYKARVRVAALDGQRVALFVDSWSCQSLTKRTVTIGLPSTPFVELGAGGWSLLSGSGIVAPGEALLFCDWSQEEKPLFLLVKVIEVPRESARVVFVGPVLTSWHRGLTMPLPPIPASHWDERSSWSMEDEEESGYAMLPEELSYQCKEVGLDLKALFPAGIMLVGPAWRSDMWQKSAVGSRVRELSTRTATMYWKGVEPVEAEGEAPAALFAKGRVVRRISVPLLDGRQALFLSGREIQVLSGYEVEIAEESSLALPRCQSYWSGVVGLVTAGSRECSLRLEDHVLGPVTIVHAGGKDSGPVEQVSHGLAEIKDRIRPDGQLGVAGETVGRSFRSGRLRVVMGWQIK